MKSRNLVICDTEEEYARALATYFMRKKELPLQVHVCSDMEHVSALESEIEADFLLLSEEYEEELSEKMKAKKVFILCTDSTRSNASGYSTLYKYQSGENIFGAMLKECTQELGTVRIPVSMTGKKEQKIIGIFSPVHRVGKTSYALKLGEQLAESENVLYLNLEIFGGIDGHFKESKQTLSDVLYYARQEKSNLWLMLASLVCHKGNLDYVAPMAVSEDMKGITGIEWAELADRILKESIYETLILDIDEGILQLYPLLEICTEIHMPVLEDNYSQAKIRQFEREARLLGRQDILSKVIRKGGSE